MRHLTPNSAVGALRRGKEIEQFLGASRPGDRPGLRWLSLSPGRDGITVRLHEVEDIGTERFFDISEFPPLDPDEEGWGKTIAVVSTAEQALELTERDLGARPNRWVNQGMAGSEYADYRSTRTSP